MTLRSITCGCGMSRPGSQAHCPSCGHTEGRELLERQVTVRPPLLRVKAPVGCGLCGLARVRPSRSALYVCPYCDWVVDPD